MPVAALALRKLRWVLTGIPPVFVFLCGDGGLALGIAGNAAVPHYARLVHVPGRGLMQHAAIVPDHRIPWRPVVMVGTRALAGEFDQVFQEALGLDLVH